MFIMKKKISKLNLILFTSNFAVSHETWILPIKRLGHTRGRVGNLIVFYSLLVS